VIGNHDRTRADIDRPARAFRGHHALQAERPAPFGADRFGSFPIHRLVEQRGEVFAHRHRRIAALLDVILEVRKLESLTEQVVQRPRRMRRETEQAGGRQLRRRGEAGAEIAFAVPTDNRVHGERQRIEPGGFCRLDHVPVNAPVLVIIELEQLGRGNRTADLLEADGRKTGDSAERPELFRCACHGAFAVVVEKALKRGRREEQRHLDALTEQRGGHVHRLHTRENARHQVAVIERCRAPREGNLVVGRPVNVVEHGRGQALFREFAEIRDVVTITETHWKFPRTLSPRL